MSKQLRTYRVWVAQVDQTFVDVKARNPEEAQDKGYAKWRRQEAHSYVREVKLVPNERDKP